MREVAEVPRDEAEVVLVAVATGRVKVPVVSLGVVDELLEAVVVVTLDAAVTLLLEDFVAEVRLTLARELPELEMRLLPVVSLSPSERRIGVLSAPRSPVMFLLA